MDTPEPEDLRQRYRPRLEEERRALQGASQETRADRRPVELDQQSVGRLSRMDALQQQAMAAAQETRRGARLRAISAAIHRLAGEEFGCCDSCGAFIGLPRLDLDPTVTRCIGCAG